MLAKVQKWGNSLGVRLPNRLTKNINIKDGSQIEITSLNNSIIIKLKEDPLDELLSKITQKNLHQEMFIEDKQKGNEEW